MASLSPLIAVGRLFRLTLGSCLLGLLGGCGNLTSWFFYPTTGLEHTPAELGLDYRVVELTTTDGQQLHNWYLPAQGEAKGSILFLHGNAQNIGNHLFSVSWLPEQGYNVLLLDYRGYGRSTGEPSLPEVLSDVDSASRWLLSQTPSPHILLGQSLGAALAVSYLGQSSAAVGVDQLVLDAPFPSYREIAELKLKQSLLGRVLNPALEKIPTEWDPQLGITSLPQPKLFIAAERDPVVPEQLTLDLYHQASEPKRLIRHPGGHIGSFSHPPTRQQLLDFLATARD